MLFGDPSTFAIEAIIEPGSALAPVFGRNVAGRFRLFFGGLEVGRFAEPGCVIRPLSEHLEDKCTNAAGLWHSSLTGKSPQAWFKLLNDALYISGIPAPPDAFHRMDFLTNVSEAFNNVKGFLFAPVGEELHALLQLPEAATVHHKVIRLSEFRAANSGFAAWVNAMEQELLQGLPSP
jgi:hypothetical protein